ncbi:MAG: cytochrome P450 [Rhodococcus sp. (in: high G+C Gram-positive bacteria)]|nr:MAG: cytochrome P450 [Rhodococcus sp. (in: high G+C Gram-positive bacteria)]
MDTGVDKSLHTTAEATIPHPRWRFPVVGDVFGISIRTPVQNSMEIGRKLGPIFERNVLGNRFVFASGADMVAELSDESRFAKHLAPGVASLREVGGDGLFTAYNHEPNWSKAHNLLAPAFTKSAMRSYHRTMLDVAGELTERWDERVDGTPVDVSSDMTKLTLETIGRTGFSYSFDSFTRERPHPFVQAMVGALSHSQRTTFVKSTALGRLLARRSDRRNVANLEHMAEVVDEVIRARDPEAFDPDHFLPERIRSRPAHVYKPFGTGERACIGRQFALHEAVLVLGTILRRYAIVGDPSYRLKVAERLTLMPEGFTLQLRRR